MHDRRRWPRVPALGAFGGAAAAGSAVGGMRCTPYRSPQGVRAAAGNREFRMARPGVPIEPHPLLNFRPLPPACPCVPLRAPVNHTGAPAPG